MAKDSTKKILTSGIRIKSGNNWIRCHLRKIDFFKNKVTGLSPATLLKKGLWQRCFPVNFAKILKILFKQNTSGRLLLHCEPTYTAYRPFK